MKVISVLIADSNLLIRRGLRALLQDHHDLEVVGEAEDSNQLKALAKELQPQVTILDAHISEGSSLDDAVYIKRVSPDTNMLVLTNEPDKEVVLKSLKCGVCGYLLKECSEIEILSAVLATAKGERYMCSKVLDVVLSETNGGASDNPNLTAREIEIIQLIVAGKSTLEIAEQLFLSHHTINSHRKNILRKLQIKSPAELIVKALDMGIVKIK